MGYVWNVWVKGNSPGWGRGCFICSVSILADGAKLDRQVRELYFIFVLFGLGGFSRFEGLDMGLLVALRQVYLFL